jgi:major membrane immunogen (membrane-anchored lipoprotein)
MKRTYLLIAISLLFLLMACGQNDTGEETDEAENGTQTEDEVSDENGEEEETESEPNEDQETASENEDISEEEQTVTEETIDGSFIVYGHRDYEGNEELLTFSFQRSDQQLSLEERLMDSLVESAETDKLDALDRITIEGSTASLYFTENEQLLSMASTEQLYFTEMLYEISSLYGIETLEFYVGDEPGVDFGQTGTVETMEVEAPDNRGFYVYGEVDEETTYISGVAAEEEMSNESGELMNFAETVEKMQSVQGDASYHSGISEGIDIVDVTVNDMIAEVHYNTADSQANLENFEHVLQLAALDFDFEHLQLNNQEEGEVKIFPLDLAR